MLSAFPCMGMPDEFAHAFNYSTLNDPTKYISNMNSMGNNSNVSTSLHLPYLPCFNGRNNNTSANALFKSNEHDSVLMQTTKSDFLNKHGHIKQDQKYYYSENNGIGNVTNDQLNAFYGCLNGYSGQHIPGQVSLFYKLSFKLNWKHFLNKT